MRMPGFTAEVSLYQSEQRYRMNVSVRRTSVGEVAPQAGQVLDPECFDLCIMAGFSRLECFQACRRPAWV